MKMHILGIKQDLPTPSDICRAGTGIRGNQLRRFTFKIEEVGVHQI